MKSLQQTLAAFLPDDKENLPRHPNPSLDSRQAGCMSEMPAKCCKNSDSWALPLPWFSFSKSVGVHPGLLITALEGTNLLSLSWHSLKLSMVMVLAFLVEQFLLFESVWCIVGCWAPLAYAHWGSVALSVLWKAKIPTHISKCPLSRWQKNLCFLLTKWHSQSLLNPEVWHVGVPPSFLRIFQSLPTLSIALLPFSGKKSTRAP